MSYRDLDSSEIFKYISCLSQFGIKINNLPRIVIVGQQNEGKSSLIEAITQIEIMPKCEGLCTRKPIYLTLINNSELKIIIGGKAYNEIEAAAEISRLNLDPKREYIDCTILSPYVYNCTIVDTVGLIHVSEQDSNLDPKKIKQDTIQYLKEKNNIFVLVSSAPSDLANSHILQLIKKYGRTEDTLGVMTKIDLIENQNQNAINDILSGKNYKLGFGWIPTKLRSDRDLKAQVSLEDSINHEYEYFQTRKITGFPFGIYEIRKAISNIQLERIKSSIPVIIDEIDNKIKSLIESQNFLQKIIDNSDGDLSHKLALMIEQLVGTSYERSQFENGLRIKIRQFLLEYMNRIFKYDESAHAKICDLEKNISPSYIDSYIYNYHVQNGTIAADLVSHDNIHEMLNTGLISPITLNNQTLQNAYKNEAVIASLIPIFELKIDDPQNTKKLAWNKYLEQYFSSLQNDDILPDKVYEITETMLLEYINSLNDDESSKHFAKYIIRNIGQSAFEDKMRYSIRCLVNIEQRPYVSIYDVVKQVIALTKSPYLDFTQFYRLRRMFSSPNSNKIELVLYSDLWNQAYLITVIDRLALNCYRIVAVDLVNKMVENLLSMVISLSKENSQVETTKIKDKIELLKQMKESFLKFIKLSSIPK
jgi:GTP-binding protein EngB required for normal cell division